MATEVAVRALQPSAVPDDIVNQEIAWNKRYMRPGIWTATLTGGFGADCDFIQWDAARGHPFETLADARSRIKPYEEPRRLVLIAGADIVPVLRTRMTIPGRVPDPREIARILGVDELITAALMFRPAPWSFRPEWCMNPKAALLLWTRPRTDGVAYRGERGSAWLMEGPGQGVLLSNVVR